MCAFRSSAPDPDLAHLGTNSLAVNRWIRGNVASGRLRVVQARDDEHTLASSAEIQGVALPVPPLAAPK